MKQNLYAWFFEGGVVGVPKRLLGLMEPLGLDFDDLGKIIYLLYAGTDEVKSDDRYAIEAARTLHGKGLVNWYTDRETIDFSPMFDKIAAALGENSQKTELTSSDEFNTNQLNYAALVKKLEREQGKFLTLKEKQEIDTAVQKYNWSYDLLYEIYMFYQKNFRRHTYDFAFFCQMAYGAKVEDSGGLARFIESLETTNTKVQEVLRRLGKYNNPTEKQKEMYLKWTNLWKFSHEMILLAADENIAADNPSFTYTDTILDNWRKEQLFTPEEVKLRKENLQKKRQAMQEAKKMLKQKGKQDKFPSEQRDLTNLTE